MMRPRHPVILLGMDAVERSRVNAMLDDGDLPNLASLRERGVWGEIETGPEAFLSMVWPSFFTGQSLGSHGWYFNKLWNPARQRLQYVDPDWLPCRPFCEDLDAEYRIALLDVPFLGAPAPGINGIFLNGWQTHDDFGRWTQPASLWRELRRRFGRPALGAEVFGPQTVETLLRQRAGALQSLDQFADVVAHVLERERWDLVVAVFGGAHRGTHYLWSLEEVDASEAFPATRRLLEEAPREIYRKWDRALGRVLDAAPSDARVLTFALHGMGPNKGWAEYFPRMVRQVHGRGEERAVPARGLIYRLKTALPWTLVRQVTTRIPAAVNHALVPLWSRRMLDWSATRFFALPSDLNGYLRVNVRGREARGIVEPGPEYEATLEEVTEAFRSFRDLRTDRPIVESVDRIDDVVGRDAARRWMLPDLVVRWAAVRAHGSPGVRSKYGEIRWGDGHRLPSGRSGNHVQGGWFAAAGPGVEPGTDGQPRDAVDIVPTVFRWLGAEPPDRFEGRPIASLVREPPSRRAPAGSQARAGGRPLPRERRRAAAEPDAGRDVRRE